MNGVEKLNVDRPKTSESQEIPISIQERSETQLDTQPLEISNQSVGFHSVSGECGISGESRVFLWFSRFWKYPFNPTYNAMRNVLTEYLKVA